MSNWKSIEGLRQINNSISGKHYKSDGEIPENANGITYNKNHVCESYHVSEPFYVLNDNGEIKYCKNISIQENIYLEKNQYNFDKELLNTSIGRIELFDEGEFGGSLDVNGNSILSGNFSFIFKFKDRKFTIDSCHHMTCKDFKLVEIFDNGSVKILYNADKLEGLHHEFYFKKDNKKIKEISEEDKKRYSLDLSYEIGYDLMFVNNDKIYFYCSGTIFHLDKKGSDRYEHIKYILEFDGENFNEIEIKFGDWISQISSIAIKDNIFYIGCDKEIIIYNTIDNSYEILTDLTKETELNLIDF